MYSRMSHQRCNCADLAVEKTVNQMPNADGWVEERPAKSTEPPEVAE